MPYTQQAIFTIASYPFSMKVLWAPIVDSVFWAKFGRRKSWLVPAQYAIGELLKNKISSITICLDAGITMLVSYNFLDGLLGYTTGSGSSNSTLGGLNDTLDSDISLDSNSTLTGEEQPDTDAVSLEKHIPQAS